MGYSRPFVTERFIAYAGDSQNRRLSLAVRVVDAFTGEPARIRLRVLLKEFRQARLMRTLGGLFCFEGIPAGDYTLVTEPDPVTADWFYLQPRPGEAWSDGFERSITLPLADPLSPLEEVTLAPKTSYPFPPNATLVRGQVTEGATPTAVAGAVISSSYNQVDPQDVDQTVTVQIETQTDAAGEYVLFFRKLPGATQPVIVTAVKNGDQVQQPVVITEGSTQIRPLHFP
jgi:hypothetical protein